jgi:hypothetical protein
MQGKKLYTEQLLVAFYIFSFRKSRNAKNNNRMEKI